ncbi:molybdopterin-dependent oxidoreductase [Allobranchiibius sp. GilTou38]|uniref:molybdopterin-dependent oxidoreductase n=1 Tax=Allobranchiibius sp. GilTou38 TaxID=2815210 RepID=UPI0032608BD3
MSTVREAEETTHEPSAARAWVAVLGGVAAGAVTIGVAELLAGLMERFGWSGGIPSPVIAVGEAFIDRTPPWLKDFAVNNFGTNDKAVLLAGIGVVLFLLSCLIGLLLRRLPVAALVGFVVLIAVAMAAVLTRPGARPADLIPTVVGGLMGLWVLHRWRGLLSVGVGRREITTERRQVLTWTMLSVVGGGLALAAGRAVSGSARAIQAARATFVAPEVQHPVQVPAGAPVDVPGITPYIVPNGQFYRIDTALQVPQVEASGWKLKVTGMVDHEVEIDWKTLLSKPMQQAMITLMCVSNEVGGSLNGNAIWTGWPVRELLKLAGPQAGADMVLSTSVDGFTAGTPIGALTDDRNALLAVAMNGKALPVEHGYPVRLVVPGLYGYVSATKWLTQLKVTTYAKDQGYWIPRGWSAMGPVKISSRIDVPRDGRSVSPGADGTVPIAGVAWDQHTGVSGVQVRIDDGPWQSAKLGEQATVDAWRQWVLHWPATKGRHTATVRAVDAKGQVQISAEAPPPPNGSTGLHSVTFTVS